jgi:hypothetical protein
MSEKQGGDRVVEKAIFKAIDKNTGETHYITDFYWFEEQGVHGMDGRGFHSEYDIAFIYDTKQRGG